MIDKNYYNLTNIAKQIKAARLNAGLTQSDAAKELNVTYQAISNYERGKTKIPSFHLARLSKLYGVNLYDIFEDSDLENNNSNNSIFSQYKRIPILGNTVAGIPIEAIEENDEYVLVDNYDNVDFALKVRGDSMIGARIYDGDLLFIKRQQKVENGEIAVVQIRDFSDVQVTTKRFYNYGDFIVLRSENPNYKEIKISLNSDKEIEILGKVIFLKAYVK